MSSPAEYLFEVPGNPRGQARHKSRAMQITKKDGSRKWVAQAYKTPEQRSKEFELEWQLMHHAPPKPHTGKIGLMVIAYYPIPESWSKKKKAAALAGEIAPVKAKPDLSNVIKHIEDVMEGIFFVNDKQICTLSSSKYYSDTPRVKIAILAEDEA